ncbi:MAG: hypothetical protein AAGH45_03310 [Pseudomonadota bacterium]
MADLEMAKDLRWSDRQARPMRGASPASIAGYWLLVSLLLPICCVATLLKRFSSRPTASSPVRGADKRSLVRESLASAHAAAGYAFLV